MDIYKLETKTPVHRLTYVTNEKDLFNYLRRWGCHSIKDVIAWANSAWFGDWRIFDHIKITVIDNRGKTL